MNHPGQLIMTPNESPIGTIKLQNIKCYPKNKKRRRYIQNIRFSFFVEEPLFFKKAEKNISFETQGIYKYSFFDPNIFF